MSTDEKTTGALALVKAINANDEETLRALRDAAQDALGRIEGKHRKAKLREMFPRWVEDEDRIHVSYDGINISVYDCLEGPQLSTEHYYRQKSGVPTPAARLRAIRDALRILANRIDLNLEDVVFPLPAPAP